jgi:hypothetical protein
VNIVKTKLTGEALQFLSGRGNLIQENVMYEILRTALIEHFNDNLPNRYCNLLHEATQGKDESPIQLSDRCRLLSAKTIWITANLVEQKILR